MQKKSQINEYSDCIAYIQNASHASDTQGGLLNWTYLLCGISSSNEAVHEQEMVLQNLSMTKEAMLVAF